MRGQRLIARIWLAIAVGAIVALTTLPWSELYGHTHWARVEWIPFTSHYRTVRDEVLNVALFVPFGASLAHWVPRVWPCTALGAMLSTAVELIQVYSHGHFPSATDVVCNTAGTAVGVLARRGWRRAWSQVRRAFATARAGARTTGRAYEERGD